MSDIGSAKRLSPEDRPVVVGLYGLPGVGKSSLLNGLRNTYELTGFSYHEGAQLLAEQCRHGGDQFDKLDEKQEAECRVNAMEQVAYKCGQENRAAVVTGHFMFWNDPSGTPDIVWGTGDSNNYTHILYLECSPVLLAQRREEDTSRHRPQISADHLQRWQAEEIKQLRKMCRLEGILFTTVAMKNFMNGKDITRSKVSEILQSCVLQDELANQAEVEARLKFVFNFASPEADTVLLLDADKTLIVEDTGELFWQAISRLPGRSGWASTFRDLFGGSMGYTYTAFRQATLLCEEALEPEEVMAVCDQVAASVTLRPEVLPLLRMQEHQKNVGVIIVSCGILRIWQMVLYRAGLLQIAHSVIAGGRFNAKYVVTPKVKGLIAKRLKEFYHVRVVAFGDSPLDMDMLLEADRGVVFVGEEGSRSKSMDAALRKAIDDDGFEGRQVLSPSTVKPRLDQRKLPILDLFDPSAVLDYCLFKETISKFHHATDKPAAKLLMTPMRDAIVHGPQLRQAHAAVGRYLSIECLTDIVGLEEHAMKHVQGTTTTGHRLKDEASTIIMPLMRGGEPMALGVNDVFPLASMLHVRRPEDVEAAHLKDKTTAILVDSVINTGASIMEVIDRVRGISPTLRVFLVAGVVHVKAVTSGRLANVLKRSDSNISLVALRLSRNSFKGSGGTDTGNRLFNTVYLD